MLHLKKIICGSLDVLADLMPVRRPVQKRSQDEHVQRSLQQIRSLRRSILHGRHSTIAMVDNRLSIVKAPAQHDLNLRANENAATAATRYNPCKYWRKP